MMPVATLLIKFWLRTDPSEEPPRLIEDEDSQTTWLEDDGSGRFPSIEMIGS